MRRRPWEKWLALTAGAGYLGLGAVAASDPDEWEDKAFREVNNPHGLMPALRLPQQLGTPWVLPAMATFGFLSHRPHLAVSAGLALPVEKGMEVGIKKLTQRRRPAKASPGSTLRDDAPATGPSYPSGHAGIAFAAVTLAAPYLPLRLVALLGGAAVAATAARVHQGAHYPLDAVGGVLLGICAGSTLNVVFGLPRSGDQVP